MADQISIHEIRLYEASRRSADWRTAKELAAAADIADRTARLHAASMAAIGLLDVQKVFGGYRYRPRKELSEGAHAYLKRIEDAKKAFRE